MIVIHERDLTKEEVLMEAVANQLGSPAPAKRVAPLTVILAMITVFFCGVLVFVYVVTKRVNPIMLDQNGHPVNSQSHDAGGKR